MGVHEVAYVVENSVSRKEALLAYRSTVHTVLGMLGSWVPHCAQCTNY